VNNRLARWQRCATDKLCSRTPSNSINHLRLSPYCSTERYTHWDCVARFLTWFVHKLSQTNRAMLCILVMKMSLRINRHVCKIGVITPFKVTSGHRRATLYCPCSYVKRWTPSKYCWGHWVTALGKGSGWVNAERGRIFPPGRHGVRSTALSGVSPVWNLYIWGDLGGVITIAWVVIRPIELRAFF